ncbi:MAG TPA: malonate transporter subunit MadL [Longimicrobiales bacterium]|nr:malonate transporter subunit MadL [Longimicrobiales bacterium]
MVIYGVALLAACMLAGVFVGELLGKLLGVQANVGGVGFAMLLLVVICDALIRRGRLSPVSQQGVMFWSAVYIPIVVAMAATQNVVAAVEGGLAAFLAGSLAVAACLLLVPAISRMGRVGAGAAGGGAGEGPGEGPGKEGA